VEKVTLYHGSRTGLAGAIRPDRSRSACDFGQGFYMGVEPHQPRTLICGRNAPAPTLYTVEIDLTGLRLLRLSANIDWALFVAFNCGLMRDYRSTRFFARYETMRRAYPGYHTLSCTVAVDKLMENLPDPGPQSTWGSREAFEESRVRDHGEKRSSDGDGIQV